MRIMMMPTLAAVLSLSGCASRAPAVVHAPLPSSAIPTPLAETNRFDMTQNGQRMSAEDFDAWMKARGIRIAKGSQPEATVGTGHARRGEEHAEP